ncbi:MAG: CoA transferase [Candidatus Tectomicrobia bacterium]|nr:CoA transferase [Candidatus Tectomicrobia bacterium]
MTRLPLEGVRVIDLTHVIAGPFATKTLADMGSEVIRVEGRGGMRTLEPGEEPKPGPISSASFSTYHELSRNKYTVAIDLTKPEGADLLKELVRIGDVLIENFSARVMEKLGLGYETVRNLKPDIIMVSMTGYGRTGPYRDYVAYGTGIEAMCGISQLTGWPDGPPIKTGVAYGDPNAGLHAAFAILAALRYRKRTGKGQHIDLSLLESLAPLVGEFIMDSTMNRRDPTRIGNRHPSIAPHGCYRCKGEERWIVIAISSDDEWERFCQALGNPAWTKDEKFSTVPGRWKYQDEIDQQIEGWTVHYEPREVMENLQSAGVPAGMVSTIRDLVHDPHMKARGYFEQVPMTNFGPQLFPGVPWKFSKTPTPIRMPSPQFGEHNDYVFGQLLGKSNEELEALKRDRVIGNVSLARG